MFCNRGEPALGQSPAPTRELDCCNLETVRAHLELVAAPACITRRTYCLRSAAMRPENLALFEQERRRPRGDDLRYTVAIGAGLWQPAPLRGRMVA